MSFKLIILFITVGLSNAQLFEFGNCPHLPVEENFKIEKYLGKWYEIARSFEVSEVGAKCMIQQFLNNSDETYSIIYKQIDRTTHNVIVTTGRGRFKSDPSEAELYVSVPSQQEFHEPYWVLGTDYDNYTVVWSCRNLGLFSSIRRLWIYARERQPSEEVCKEVQDVLRRNDISQENLLKTDQTNCPDDY